MNREKPQHPDYDIIARTLEVERPGYGRWLAQTAADWPRRSFDTAALVRRQLRADWNRLPSRVRAAAIKAATPTEKEDDDDE